MCWDCRILLPPTHTHHVYIARSEQVRDESLKSKMAELHLNCQLLVTQISNIKSTVATAQPDVKVTWLGPRK